jgi:hypothetical protein
MTDVTIIGSGAQAQSCADVLARAGFSLSRAFELQPGDRSPVILGDLQGAFRMAREVVESGRHVLVATSYCHTPERLSLLLQSRKRSQALFVWSERRYHPGYRLITGLSQADATWKPRYLRQETLSIEPAEAALFRWRLLESIALVTSIAAEEPVSVNATAALNALRNAPDSAAVGIAFKNIQGFVQVGLGEALDRRETLIAAAGRKAFVDELGRAAPLRIIEDDGAPAANGSRGLLCQSLSPQEATRQQCVAFLEATRRATLAQAEATTWSRALSVLRAAETSYGAAGRSVPLTKRDDQPYLRLVGGATNLRALG